MTTLARQWFRHYLTPFRTGTLHDFLRAARSGQLTDVLSPLVVLANAADGLTGTQLVLAATRYAHQADMLTEGMDAMKWLWQWDEQPREAMVAAICEEVESEIRRRGDPLGVGRN